MSKKWPEDALIAFWESFVNLIECSDPRAKTLLKYVLIAAIFA